MSRSGRAPVILLPAPEDPKPTPAGRVVLVGEFLLCPGDGYAITVLLSGHRHRAPRRYARTAR